MALHSYTLFCFLFLFLSLIHKIQALELLDRDISLQVFSHAFYQTLTLLTKIYSASILLPWRTLYVILQNRALLSLHILALLNNPLDIVMLLNVYVTKWKVFKILEGKKEKKIFRMLP